MHRRQLTTLGSVAALAIAALMGGCGDATTGPTSVNPQDFAASLRLISGNSQRGAIGAALPEVLSVKVLDAGGQPVSGATVIWQVRSGGGAVNPPASTSSESGLASVTWTLGSTLGANKVVAILQGNYVKDSISFDATALTGAASQFKIAAGNAQTGRVAAQLATPLSVTVKDAAGNPLVGQKVTWTPGNLSGTITPLADSTDNTGTVRANWTLGNTVVAQTATANLTGLAPLAFTATATPDTSRVMTITGGASQVALAGSSLTTPISVKVADRFGNVIAGDTVIFNDSLSPGSKVASASVNTDAAGLASTTWTLGSLLGTQTVRARVHGTVKATWTATSQAEYAKVYAGNYFTCGVTTSERTFCWGYGADGQRGNAAQKSVLQASSPVTIADTLDGPFPTFRTLSAGTSFVCGVTLARQAYCWGRQASVTQTNTATLRNFNADVVSFLDVSVSDAHHCLLLTDGRIACNGSNSLGQLGDGTTTDQTVNYAVAAAAVGLPWVGVATGGSFTCGMPRFNPADSANTVRIRCWGANTAGQLGGATVTNNSTTAVAMDMTGLTVAWDTTSLVAGNSHACALTRAGAAYCWGSNLYGQLGGGSNIARDSVPMAVAGGPFTKLYAGEFHTCGITTTNTAYCWGRNNSGQLGDGSTTNSNAPVLVGGGLTWRQLSLGELHTCGVANPTGSGSGTQLGKGVIYCWGDNEYGQLGTGVATGNGVVLLSPQRVAGQP